LYYLDPSSKLRFNEAIGIRLLRFSNSFAVKTHTITYYAYLNFENKIINPPSNASINFVVSATLLFFVDVDEDPIMANDVTTSSNPLVTLIRNENFEKTPFDVNVPQRSCEEEPIGRVVYI
jgi:hypothetical protein